MTSKFSSANPSGSITAWQLAHDGLLRCALSRSRIVGGAAPGFGGGRLVSTPAGGGVVCSPKTLFSRNLPRNTGDVRSGYDVVDRSAPWARARRAGSCPAE
jgi:hypothetical protein